MTTRTKEEEKLLDEKIARIQRQNEEILRRQKEIEEDKKLAEKNNAIVKLKAQSANTSRERTPALKPSNRETREDYHQDEESPVIEQTNNRILRTNRGRGLELYRRSADDHQKSSGPPPDPRSFLYDEERDSIPQENELKQNRRRKEDERNFREDRGFSRSSKRGSHDRGGGGRRGGRGGGRGARSEEEEEWRAERMRIDEARIQRQKAADGRWRREWDNEKIPQEPQDESKTRYSQSGHHEFARSTRNQQYESEIISSPEFSQPQRPFRGGITRGRGRGRLDPSELESQTDSFHFEPVLKPPVVTRRTGGMHQRPATSPTSPSSDDFQFQHGRTVQCVGSNFKISVDNSTPAHAEPRPQRPIREARGRFRPQHSYSSQSDEESPRDRFPIGSRRQRRQPQQPSSNSAKTRGSTIEDRLSKTKPNTLNLESKPPIPPATTTEKSPSSGGGTKEDDESWEDITTSGNESFGEDYSSTNSSPDKKPLHNTVVVNRVLIPDCTSTACEAMLKTEPSLLPFDEYLKDKCAVDSNDFHDNSLESKQSLARQFDNTVCGITSLETCREKNHLTVSDSLEIERNTVDLSHGADLAVDPVEIGPITVLETEVIVNETESYKEEVSVSESKEAQNDQTCVLTRANEEITCESTKVDEDLSNKSTEADDKSLDKSTEDKEEEKSELTKAVEEAGSNATELNKPSVI